MIGSITEQRDQLMALERRRQEIAAQQSAAPVTNSLPVTAAPLAPGMPAAGYASPPAALKGAQPDVTKPGRMPSAPKPEEAHISWAKRMLGDGYQASVRDQVDASRILEAAGLKPDDFHAGKPADSAPPGARDIAAAHLAREQAMTDPNARKSYAERDIILGPAEGKEPGHPAPENFDRGYLEAGHAAEAPMSEGPRTNPNPLPSAMRGVPVPIALSTQTMAAVIPQPVAASLSMGSPSDK